MVQPDRPVRMPVGSEGLHWEPSATKIHGYLYSVFSSESNMMVPVTKQLKMLGEDRYFVWNTPVMRSDPGTVKSNYLYWQFLGNRISHNTAVVPGMKYVLRCIYVFCVFFISKAFSRIRI